MTFQSETFTAILIIAFISICRSSQLVILSSLASSPLGSSQETSLPQHERDACTSHHMNALVSYKQARDVRTKEGHAAAVPYYQHLISRFQDVTAASRIAASPSSPLRHDLACPIDSDDDDDDDTTTDILRLQNVLKQSDYNNRKIQQLFGIRQLPFGAQHADGGWSKAEALAFARGPVFVKPVAARPQSQLPSLLDDVGHGSSLRCLVAMFLLGFAVPKDILSTNLIGGEDTIALLESLGLAFPCENDSSIIVPYVHLFPLEIPAVRDATHGNVTNVESNSHHFDMDDTRSLVIVTDCHPTILCRTTVGAEEDGAVMYIGPDSLALLQHHPIHSHLTSVLQSKKELGEHFSIVDFCTGSGVQALCALLSLQTVDPDATAICVDVNDRALRFTRFNALLNGIDSKRVYTVKADLISGKLLEPKDGLNCVGGQNGANDLPSSIFDLLLKGLPLNEKGQNILPNAPFDLVLANPPFIPTPKEDSDSSISQRYGLFSSGGASGEEVLRSIVFISSRLLKKKNGLLAIVSEFMNPPALQQLSEVKKEIHSTLLDKLSNWWKGDSVERDANTSSIAVQGRGILFTNEVPVPAMTYAARRADDEGEYEVWIQNMHSCSIHHVSPGQLYIKTGQTCHQKDGMPLDLHSELVPRDKELGSIWTPYNYKAILCTKEKWDQLDEHAHKC